MTSKRTILSYFLFLLLAVPVIAYTQNDSLAIEKKLAGLSPGQKILYLDTVAFNYSETKPALGLSYTERALQLIEENDLQKLKGRVMTTIATIHRKTGNMAKAEIEMKSAVELNKSAHDTEGLYHAYLASGNLAYFKGDYATAIGFFSQCHDLAAKLHNIAGVAGICNNIANIYYAQKEFNKALSSYSEARDIYVKSGNKTFAALALDNMANCYQNLKMIDKSKEAHLQALAEIQQSGAPNQIVETAINTGVFFIDQKDYETGIKYLELALQSARSNHFLLGEVIALLNFSEVYQNADQVDKAIEASKEAAQIAENAGLNDYALSAYEQLAQIFENNKNPADALVYYKKARDLRDTLFSSEKQQLLADMSAKYETAKKDDEISNLTLEKERKQQQLFLLGGGLLLVILISLVLVRVNAARRTANKMLGDQNKIIAEKNKDITDSITYALRIQKSVMSDERILEKAVSEYFILNKPRDIVSGDFFWLAQKDNRNYIAVADCTGHGVPGALVSVVGINLLNKIIEMPGTPSPSGMLELLHKMMIHALNKDTEMRESNDGMDIALLCLDKNSNKAIFAGAGRPLYYVDKNGFNYIKGDRYSVAGEKKESDAPFFEQEISLSGPISFYLSSDGFVDQFGEKTGKKFLSKRFQELLQSISHLPMSEQHQRIEKEFASWKGGLEQVDDILVMGIKV